MTMLVIIIVMLQLLMSMMTMALTKTMTMTMGSIHSRGPCRPRSPRSRQPQVRGVHHVRSAELGNGQADCTTKVSLTTAVAQICSRLVEGFWLGNVILCVPAGVVETPAGPTAARAGRRRVRAPMLPRPAPPKPRLPA